MPSNEIASGIGSPIHEVFLGVALGQATIYWHEMLVCLWNISALALSVAQKVHEE